MRALLIGMLLVGVTASILLARNWSRTVTTPLIPSPSQPASPSPIPPDQSVDVAHDGISYRIAWLPIPDPSKLTLLSNFTQKRTARSLIDGDECAQVVNGGFYTTDGEPTGLFTSDGQTTRDASPNAFLNGYLVVDRDNDASIRPSPPEESVRIGLQTGPILIRDGNTIALTIRDDEFARRIIAAITQNSEIVFLALYDPDNPWSGPKLADTPYILSKVTARLHLTDAVNLDGGSASAFIRGDLSLDELTPVGSFFCVR